MIKCTNCGKVFDEEKYYGICPKCATYNRPKRNDNIDELFGFHTSEEGKTSTERFGESDHDRMHRQYDGMSSDKIHKNVTPTYEQMQKHLYQKRNRNCGQELTPKKKSKAIVGMIFGTIFAVTIVLSLLICFLIEKNARKAEYSLEYERQTVETGETFYYYDVPVTIYGAREVDTSLIKDGLPQGHKMIVISLEVSNEEYNWITLDDQVYIACGDTFKRPIHSSEMGSVLTLLGIPEDMIFSPNAFLHQDGQGVFIALVDEDVEQVTLVLEEREEEHKIQVLKKRYELTLPIGE